MAKKNILDDAKRVGFSHDSQVLYGMPAFWRIRDAVRDIWNNTKAEPNRERIPVQYRMVSQYKEDLEREVISDYTFYTAKNLSSEDMRLDTYFNEVEPEIERLFDEGKDKQSLWHMSIDVMHDLLNNVYGSNLIFRELDKEKFFRSVRVDKELDETEHYTKDYLYNFYDLYCGELAFRVCRLVEEWYFIYTSSIDPDAIAPEVEYFEDEGGEMPFLSGREIATYAEVACLYIALRNEQNKLKEEAELYGIPLEKETKPKQRVQDNESWRTERAEKYFKKALEAGLMEEADGFSWHKFPKTALAYFLQRIYDPDPKAHQEIPYKMLGRLFGVTRLEVSLDKYNSSLQKQAWKKEIDKLFEED